MFLPQPIWPTQLQRDYATIGHAVPKSAVTSNPTGRSRITRRGGETADAAHSKCAEGNLVGVRIPLPAPQSNDRSTKSQPKRS